MQLGARLHGQVLPRKPEEGARLRGRARRLHAEDRRHLLLPRVLHAHACSK